MNYEEKYKKVLSFLKDLKPHMSDYCIEKLDGFFPELQESDDERIRTFLHHTFTAQYLCKDKLGKWHGEPVVNILAWLEKQREQNPEEWCFPYNVNETVDKLMAIAECLEMDEDFLYNGYTGTECVKFLRDLARKQVECKPADKVEPKFKIGDWCIDNEDGTIFQIVKVLDNTYTYKTNEDEEYSCTHYSLENDAKLWTIQDVNDGDVLAYFNGITEIIMIFKSWFVEKRTAYTHFHICDNISRVNDFCICGSGVHPATKEQRDQLEKAMVDAGYKWNKEEHKLEKNMNNTFLPQTSTWSEEDELMIQDAIYWINEFQKSNKCKDENDMQNSVTCENWLKSIKDRVQPQPKQEWSKEDERIRQCLIEDQEKALDEVRNDKYGHSEIISDLKEMYHERIDWLKSLNPNHWKPSEKQMEALLYALGKGGTYNHEALTQLYNNLKTL